MQLSTMFRSLVCMAVLTAAFHTAFAENPRYRISVTRGDTPLGDIVVELFPQVAPKHVKNFDSLVSIGFYDGTAFHRVIPNFMIQGGDPNSRSGPRNTWGYGDPSQTTVPAEFSTISHVRGILSAARRGDDTNSATSQFFICVAAATHLDGDYSVYGEVKQGMDVADAIVQSPRDAANNPIEKVEMVIEKLAPTGVDDPLCLSINSLTTRPNPASDELSLRFSLASPNTVHYALYDNLGNEVGTATAAYTAGEHTLAIDVSTLPPGVYYCRLYTGAAAQTAAFIIAR